jgi:hypothetical protein
MSDRNDGRQRPKRGDAVAGYMQPSRMGKKPLVGYFDKEAHKAIKQLALDKDRTVEDLMREAFYDLLMKVSRPTPAKLFQR